MTTTQPTYLLRVGTGYETNADGSPREYQGKAARAALKQMRDLTHSTTVVKLERKQGPATWRYLPDDAGSPIVGPNNMRICDMDCVDFYELTDNDADVQAYERQRDEYAALIIAAPRLLEALRKIANYPGADVLRYVQEVDSIACETLAALDFSL